jgi:hypothetical protein
VLNHCRFDKIKPVREATLETIKLIKEIGPPLDEDQLAAIDDKPTKTGGIGGRGNGAMGGRDGRNSGSKSARNRKFEATGSGSLSNDESVSGKF